VNGHQSDAGEESGPHHAFALAVLETHAQHGDETVVLDPGSWHEVCRFLRDAPPSQMDMLTDLTAVDFPDRDPRA